MSRRSLETKDLWAEHARVDAHRARLQRLALIALVAANLSLIAGMHFDEAVLTNSSIPLFAFALYLGALSIRLTHEAGELLREIREGTK